MLEHLIEVGVGRQGTPTAVGSSMAVSRLGEVLHRLGAGPEVLVVDVDPATVDDARHILPVLANRRSVLA